MNLSGTCAADSPVEIRLRQGRRHGLWQFAGLTVALAAILAAELAWPWLLAALSLLWIVARLAPGREAAPRAIVIHGEDVLLETAAGTRLRLKRPLRCQLQPGVITLALPRWRRVRIFSDQCSAEAFRTLRRLLSAGADA